MAEHHRLLLRQIRRHLNGLDIEHMGRFLDAVSEAYSDSDAERQMLERALELSSGELLAANNEMKAVFTSLPDEFLLMGAGELVLDHKPGVGRSIVDETAAVGKKLGELIPERLAGVFRSAVDDIAGGVPLKQIEFVHRMEGTGELTHFEARFFPLLDGKTVALLRDITERRRAEDRISHVASHDSLTGLPNRHMLSERLEGMLSSSLSRGEPLGVLTIGLDRFKAINDTFGHSLGDELLVAVTQRLRRSVRVTDLIAGSLGAAGNLIARMGGDEFTVVINNVDGADRAGKVCQRLVEELAKPMVLQGHEIFTSVSIGASVSSDEHDDAQSLLARAGMALFFAKQSGRNTYRLFEPSMKECSRGRVDLESDLRHAGTRGELSLNYQPLVDAVTGDVTAMEALLRWNHPTRGFVSPGVFIPLAEESDLILSVGEWVINEACRQLRSWLDAGYHPPRVSINLSARQFWRRDVVSLVREALVRTAVPSTLLGIELTETAMVHNPELCSEAVSALRDLGVCVYLDDFGTGYSSLGYLKRFAVDVLKIDGAFVRDIATDDSDAALIRAIIAMGHGLGLKVVAECVETPEQLAFLQAHGCDIIQGYLVCKPLPGDDPMRFVAEQRARVSACQWPPIQAAS